jgi:penicillin-binding protein 2
LPVQPANLAAIKEGLNGVPTALGGTGYTAFKDYTGPPAAGKTGTAETGTKGVTHAWFAAYAPQVEPKLVVISLVEEGKDAEGEGSRVAAPIARMIFEKILPGGPAQPIPAPKPAAKPAPTPGRKP